ncbi:YlmH/Sll1252 family protein [Clostridium sp. KNHs214]|uniref:YlmH family RNA-binding protein n=1 Tax=Clostridium sp. KNHs214 TaxID=1540257 RepID=UPI0005503748|nr:YlmH/Sll1252 family protein [Clostridium sp. KNHs214]
MDKNKLSNIEEKICLAYKANMVVYSNEFYTPDECNEIKTISNKNSVNFYSYGVFKDSERRMVAFSTEEEKELFYPLELLKIKANTKFLNLQHKDFLGSIMALGIKREKLGDLILKEDCCYLPVEKDMVDFIKYNLQHINKSPCKISLLDILTDEIPQYSFEEKVIIITSNRLDSMVSSLCNVSRSKAIQWIGMGNVLIDYVSADKKDCRVKTNSVITVRGYGKYKIGDILGYTQKDRIKMEIKKFI